MRAAVLVAAAALASNPTRGPVAQREDTAEDERRFTIVAVTDSTVTLIAPRERWMRRGAYGIAVDPRQRDALVGRLRVLSRAGDSTIALVTGQTTRMSTDYVAIFRRPATPTIRQRVFWGGLFTGLAAGVGAVLLITRTP